MRVCLPASVASPPTMEARRTTRSGLTLLEVVIALAIFLFSLAAIGQLLSFSKDRVVDGYLKSQANLRCDAKLAEVLTGAEPLSSASGSYSDDPSWSWQLNCTEHDTVPNLWNVQVTVERKKNKETLQVSLSQMMFAPTARGSTLVDLGNVTDGPNKSTAKASTSSSASAGGGGGTSAKGGGTTKGGTGGTTTKGGGGTTKGGSGTTKGGTGGGTGTRGGGTGGGTGTGTRGGGGTGGGGGKGG